MIKLILAVLSIASTALTAQVIEFQQSKFIIGIQPTEFQSLDDEPQLLEFSKIQNSDFYPVALCN